MILLPYLNHTPQLGAGAAGDPSSAVIGRARVGAGLRLDALATLRADGQDILIGEDNWFGAASTVHIADSRLPTETGAHVTVGRFALVHACRIGEDCVIGEGAVVMDGAEVGAGAVLAAESLVPPGKRLPGGWLYAGIPAQPVKEIDDAARARWHAAVRSGDSREAFDVLWAPQPIVPEFEPGRGVETFYEAYVAPTASLAGRVTLGREASAWFGVLLDAGESFIDIGEGANIQDNSWLRAGRGGIRIGRHATLGHNVRMASCVVGERAMVGMGAVVGEGTVVKDGGCIAAGAVTEPGTVVEANWLWSGRPARPSRELSDRNRQDFSRIAEIYIGYARNYLKGVARAA